MSDNKRLIILDLDDTLFHSSELPLDRSHDFEAFDYYVYVRPSATRFVEKCFDLFEVAVWTTAVHDYAQRMIDEIFPANVKLEFLWDRSRCSITYDTEMRAQIYVKDLAKVKKLGWTMDEMLIVDDSPETAQRNFGNLVPVESYYGEPEDDELSRLIEYLPTLASCEQIRKLEKRGWRTRVSST